MPVAKRFESVADFKQRRLARKQKEKYIFWGIIAGIGSIVFLSSIFYFSANTPAGNQRKIAALVVQLENAKTEQEVERIAAEIDRLEKAAKSAPSRITVEIKKPFRVYQGSNMFDVVIEDVVFLVKDDPANRIYDLNKGYVKFVIGYSYKNLGPEEGSLRLSSVAIKTDKGHIYKGGGEIERGMTVENYGIEVVYEAGIEKTGKGGFFLWVPEGIKPVELGFSVGDSAALIKLPKSLPTWSKYYPVVPDGFCDLNLYKMRIIKQ
jgi:hypothetical protein